MKTVVIKVNSSGTGMQDALDLSENLAADVGLSRSENLRLRLLAEELCGGSGGKLLDRVRGKKLYHPS